MGHMFTSFRTRVGCQVAGGLTSAIFLLTVINLLNAAPANRSKGASGTCHQALRRRANRSPGGRVPGIAANRR